MPTNASWKNDVERVFADLEKKHIGKYLLTSGLLFGVIFHFLYLWFFPRPYIKIEDDDNFRKYPAEFREIFDETPKIKYNEDKT